jgi:hypothetical protein
MITEKQIEWAMEILIDRESNAAKNRAANEYMDDLTAVVLAKLINEAPDSLKSADARKAWALAQPQYTAHIEQKKAVAEMDYKARDRRSAASAIIDAWRTEQSSARLAARVG